MWVNSCMNLQRTTHRTEKKRSSKKNTSQIIAGEDFLLMKFKKIWIKKTHFLKIICVLFWEVKAEKKIMKNVSKLQQTSFS